MAILVGKESRVLIQGITGREATMVAKQMLDYGTPVIAGVTPGRGGQNVEAAAGRKDAGKLRRFLIAANAK